MNDPKFFVHDLFNNDSDGGGHSILSFHLTFAKASIKMF